MARIIVLDSTPLGLLSRGRGHPRGDACRLWLDAIRPGGIIAVVAEVADYEVRRELIRVGATAGIARLDSLSIGLAYDPISTALMRRAAEFWADLRRRGLPTASDQGLDADAILAAQAALIGGPGDRVTVATSNTSHFSRFPGIDARDWPSITP